MTKLSFIEGEGIERQTFGQEIYIVNSDKTKVELFSCDIYFGNQDLSVSDSLSGVIGNNTYFKPKIPKIFITTATHTVE